MIIHRLDNETTLWLMGQRYVSSISPGGSTGGQSCCLSLRVCIVYEVQANKVDDGDDDDDDDNGGGGGGGNTLQRLDVG